MRILFQKEFGTAYSHTEIAFDFSSMGLVWQRNVDVLPLINIWRSTITIPIYFDVYRLIGWHLGQNECPVLCAHISITHIGLAQLRPVYYSFYFIFWLGSTSLLFIKQAELWSHTRQFNCEFSYSSFDPYMQKLHFKHIQWFVYYSAHIHLNSTYCVFQPRKLQSENASYIFSFLIPINYHLFTNLDYTYSGI